MKLPIQYMRWGLCTIIIWQNAAQILEAVCSFEELVIDEDNYIICFANLQYFDFLGTDLQSNFLSAIF